MKLKGGRNNTSSRKFRSPGGRPVTVCTVNISDTTWEKGDLLFPHDEETGTSSRSLSHDVQLSVASLNNLVRNGLIKRSLFPAKSLSKQREQEEGLREELIPYMNVAGVKPETFPIERSRKPFAAAMFKSPEVLRTRNGRDRGNAPLPVVKPLPVVHATIPHRHLPHDLLTEPEWGIEKAYPMLKEMLGPKTSLVLDIRKEYLVNDGEDEYFAILKNELFSEESISRGSVEYEEEPHTLHGSGQDSFGGLYSRRRASSLRRASMIPEPSDFIANRSWGTAENSIGEMPIRERKISFQGSLPRNPGSRRVSMSPEVAPERTRMLSVEENDDGLATPLQPAGRTLSASPVSCLRRGSMFLQGDEGGTAEDNIPVTQSAQSAAIAEALVAPPLKVKRKSLKVSFMERFGSDSGTDREVEEVCLTNESPSNDFVLKQRRRQSYAVPAAARNDSDDDVAVFAKPILRASRTMTEEGFFGRSKISEGALPPRQRKESVTPDAYAAALAKTPDVIRKERKRFDPRAEAKAKVDWASVVMTADSTLHFVIVNRILKILAPSVPVKVLLQLRLISRRWDKAVRMSFEVKAESVYQSTEELRGLRSYCPGVVDLWRNVIESRIGVCVLARRDSDEPRLSQSPGVWTIRVIETLHYCLEGHGDTGWGGELRPYIAEYRSRASKMQQTAGRIELHKMSMATCRSFMHVIGQMLHYKNNINPTDSPLTQAGARLCMDIARLWAVLHWDELSESVPSGLMPPEWESKTVAEKADWQVALMSHFRLLDDYRELRSVVNVLKLVHSRQ